MKTSFSLPAQTQALPLHPPPASCPAEAARPLPAKPQDIPERPSVTERFALASPSSWPASLGSAADSASFALQHSSRQSPPTSAWWSGYAQPVFAPLAGLGRMLPVATSRAAKKAAAATQAAQTGTPVAGPLTPRDYCAQAKRRTQPLWHGIAPAPPPGHEVCVRSCMGGLHSYQNALLLLPGHTEAVHGLKKLARQQRRLGHFRCAEDSAREALRHQPLSIGSSLLLAKALEAQQLDAAADAVMHEALAARLVHALETQVIQAWRHGTLQEAHALLDSVATYDENNPRLWLLRAVLHFEAGQDKRAWQAAAALSDQPCGKLAGPLLQAYLAYKGGNFSLSSKLLGQLQAAFAAQYLQLDTLFHGGGSYAPLRPGRHVGPKELQLLAIKLDALSLLVPKAGQTPGAC